MRKFNLSFVRFSLVVIVSLLGFNQSAISVERLRNSLNSPSVMSSSNSNSSAPSNSENSHPAGGVSAPEAFTVPPRNPYLTTAHMAQNTGFFAELNKIYDQYSKSPNFNAVRALTSLYGQLQASCEEYSQSICEDLSKPILKLFLMLASILLLWKIGVEGVLRKNIDPLGLFKLLFLISILSAFISQPNVFLKYFYHPLKELTMDTTAIVIKHTSSGENMEGDIQTVLGKVSTKFDTALAHASSLVSSSYVNMGAILVGILLSIVFHLISYLFLFYIADLYFGLMILVALGPLFLAAYLFPLTRGYGESALRMAVSCCLTVIFAGLAMGLTLNLTANFISLDPGSKLSDKTWQLLCIGFLSLLFMRRAPQIAASITNTAESGSSSLMVGMAITAASMAKTGAMFGSGKILGAAASMYGKAKSGSSKSFEPIPMFKDGPAKD